MKGVERIRSIWRNMKRRCNDPTNNHYHRYGGRGISYCEEWESSETFIKWAKKTGYRDNLTLDRIDNDGNYTPDNCRWVDMKAQCYNRSDTLYIEHEGEIGSILDWSIRYNLDESLIRGRYYNGVRGEELFYPKQDRHTYITYKGETKILADWAREFEINPDKLYARLNLGKSFEEAIQKHVCKTITINGETHNLSEWAKIMGIYPQLIRSRIQFGMSPKDAVLTPLQKK